MIDKKSETFVKKYEMKLDEIESDIAAMKKSVDKIESLCITHFTTCSINPINHLPKVLVDETDPAHFIKLPGDGCE
ncbi:hypothetical protein PGT21_021842 [Puccinia graminis f. sp. tritici]|uniref:Uncharacterized protein n=1 Tax=Puccinia graminis f. sp. tritici TaxID=56615 RepID=A0A5B0RU99_PUCGR|nr:hypothetical protein PGT21_021842 [Puccinia graminis f. sp. tritici]KAA1129137.1 hypothetical protein PGTUg99_031291 [Puccinia graminis f. sp. tritici]